MKNLKHPDDLPVIILGYEQPVTGAADSARPHKKEKNRHLWEPEKETLYMSRIANGDREAFSEVVQLYMLDLYRFACSILGDKSRAEDITQETCMRLWTRAAQWSPEGRIKNWLFRITHNLCIDEIRSRRAEHTIDDFIFTIADQSPDAAASYADGQVSRLVTRALFALPERQRTALTLVHYSEYSNNEAARIMNVSVDALESLLARGRQNLRLALSEHKKSIFE